MDWDGTRSINTEQQKHKRWIKEAIEIRRRGHNHEQRRWGLKIESRMGQCHWRGESRQQRATPSSAVRR
uniref:Uncharacterized protein n=1 Tax=Nothobranchius furzeri TaxID=105023 RepID=A0A1A7ZZD7_NOTFU